MKTEMINDRKYFTYDVQKAEALDMTAVKMIERNEIDGLLPFKYVKQGERQYFRYEAEMGETLEEWCLKAQYRKDVMRLIESIIIIGEETDAYLLEKNNIEINSQFLLVKDNQCKAAYIPIAASMQGSLLDLVYFIVSKVKYARDEDFHYLFDLQNAFGRKDIRNMEDLKKWLRIVSGEESMPEDIEPEAPMQTAAKTYTKAPAQAFEKAPEAEDASVEDASGGKSSEDSLENIFGSAGLGGKVKKEKKEKKEKKHISFAIGRNKEKTENDILSEMMQSAPTRPEAAVPPKEIINDLDRGDMTVMVDTAHIPVLKKAGGGMEYPLMQNSYTIGSGAQADIVIQNNKAVSRNHARIFKEGDYWYIVDSGSTNGTCASGEKLRAMEPYKLEDGTGIQFANEKYIFQMD